VARPTDETQGLISIGCYGTGTLKMSQSEFDYEAGNRFLERLHDGSRHYVPIFDSVIYIPNPEVESDA
jgi:hypothetical protein